MTAPERTTIIQHTQAEWGRLLGEAGNQGTKFGAWPRELNEDPAAAFNRHHLEMLALLQQHGRPGVMLFVVSPRGLVGHAWAATTDRLRTVSIGRHSSCQFPLGASEFVSLRQVLVLVGRAGDPWRARVIDLSTEWGFSDETGFRHRHVAFDRVAVLGVPGFWLFFLVTGTGLRWNPAEASPWDTLVPREYRLESSVERARPRLPRREERERSLVTSFRAPLGFWSRELVQAGESSDGALVIRTAQSVGRFAVGPDALERGVLLGRDPRCGSLGFRLPGTVSRVHGLVLGVGGEVFLADAGSTNGIWSGRAPVRIARMDSGQVFRLGPDAVEVEWLPAN